jgi:hypothetical protein
MPKRATAIVLSEKEQEGLLQITKRHRSEQQVVRRSRIVLAAAQGFSNAHIARELGESAGHRASLAGSLGGTARDRPGDNERGLADAGCSPSWGDTEVYHRTTLSDGGAGL